MCGEMELVLASYSRVKILSGERDFIRYHLFVLRLEPLSIRAIFTGGTVAEAFSVAPTFAEGANGRQSFRCDSLLQNFCFVLKVAIKPVVADFVDRNNVDGLINPSLGGNAQGCVAANCLNVHAADFESGAFKQKAVVGTVGK